MKNRCRYSRLILCVVLLLVLECCSSSSNKNSEVARFLRHRRSLVYPDPRGSETKVQVLFGLGLPMEGQVSMTLGYVVKCNYNLPYNSSQLASEFDSRASKAKKKEIEKEIEVSRGVSRWSVYRLLESVLGKSCLLRAVCEAAEVPLSRVHEQRGSRDSRIDDLLGQLLHALLAPSMTSEEYETYADREYRAAEGRGANTDCRPFYRDCPYSPLDYFTQILHF